MILNGNDIKKLIDEVKILENYDIKNINSSSCDVSISDTILTLKSSGDIVDLSNFNDVEDMYMQIDISNGYILKSNDCVLVSLKEHINLPNNLCANIRPRTSFSRLGLVINFQHINAGYKGILNILLHNSSPNDYKIYPNMRIGQIVFDTLSSGITDNLLYFNEKSPTYYDEKGNLGSKIYTDFIGKVFRHYKGNYYFVEDISVHSETKEYMVVYKTLYDHKDSNLWVRPAKMFFEKINKTRTDNITGQSHRFELVSDLSKDFNDKKWR